MQYKHKLKKKRQQSIRKRVSGTTNRPRVSINRSNKYLYCQVINDEEGKVLVGKSDKGMKGNKTETAKELGKVIAEMAIKLKVSKVVFDRSGYKYHGRVKALADSMRENGLDF